MPTRKFIAVLFGLFTTIGLFTLQTVAQTCDSPQGTIERNGYRSVVAETDMVYSIYLPPCYAEETRDYPVIYLKHGSNDDDGQWVRLGLPEVLDAGIASGLYPPMIVVMPFANWIGNENQFGRVSWENVFLEELLPLVEAQYRIDQRREMRAIGGISRGGFWAFEVAYRHPDLFRSVGGHSAFFAERQAPPDFDPITLASNAPGLATLRIALDRGADDYAAPGLDVMSERLTAAGIPHTYTIYPEGQHANSYWRAHVADYLAFYSAEWVTMAAVETAPNLILMTNTPNPSIVYPTSTPQITTSSTGYDIFLPAVGFPSLETQIGRDVLQVIRAGSALSNLVVDQTTMQQLSEHGVILNPGQVVSDDALYNTLWRDGALYTLLAFDRLNPRYRVLRIEDTHPLDLDPATYPFAFTDSDPNYHPERLTRLLMSGVTALTRRTRTALDENDVQWAADGILPYVSHTDFFHTSNEVSFSPGCPGWDSQPLGEFCSKMEHFQLFDLLGLDIVDLNGNHNVDFGAQAYLDTLQWYRDRGIRTLGGGENIVAAQQPVRIEHDGNSIALLSCNWVGPYYALADDDEPGAATCAWNWLREVIPPLAAETDTLIVTVQYLEYEEYVPRAAQRSDFRGLADLGADIVIGTHAHKPQTMEFYNAEDGTEAYIHYGLGNLFFDQPFWGNSRFFMDQLFIYEGHLLSVDLFVGIIDDLARPRRMTADEERNFLAFMFNTQGAF
jgi:enterochelin esterase-like enzyme